MKKRDRADPDYSNTRIPENTRAVKLTGQCVSRTDIAWHRRST